MDSTYLKTPRTVEKPEPMGLLKEGEQPELFSAGQSSQYLQSARY